MGDFDGLTASSFKTDSEGRTVFYPFGIFGAGRIVPDTEEALSIRNSLKKIYLIFLTTIIALQVFVGTWATLSSLPVYLAVMYFWISRRTKGFEKSPDKLSFQQSIQNSAEGQSMATLILLFCISAAFTITGGLMIWTGANIWVGWLGLIFFGFCAATFVLMINVKRRAQ